MISSIADLFELNNFESKFFGGIERQENIDAAET
jgi:hypothetical protein